MGSFINDNLMPGEKIFYQAKVHWVVFFNSAILFVMTLVIFWFGKYHLHINSNLVPVLSTAMLLLAIWKFLQAYCHRQFTEMAITDSRLIAKFGVIRREVIELPLAKIESVIVEQSISERLMDAGSVGVRGTGMAMAPIGFIDQPIQFRNALNEAIAHAKQNNN